jgi:hypothetical protein
MPGGPAFPYSANPRCRSLNSSFLAGGKGRHAGWRIVAFIVVTIVVRAARGNPQTKSPEVFRLSGLCGEFLAGDDEDYSVVLPE